MSVTVDDLPLETERLGLATVGDVLTHVAGDDRLVVQVLLDGSEPDLAEIEGLRSTRLEGRVLFVETARPGNIACEALDAVDDSLAEADEARVAAAEHFRSGEASTAMQKLSSCFPVWINAQESIGKVAKLLRADLALLKLDDGRPVAEVIGAFAGALRQLKEALEARDYVLCCDVLTYDMGPVADDWRAATAALRRVAGR